MGVMVESHLVAGRQDLVPGKPLTYGQSITDGCIDWETTVPGWSGWPMRSRRRRQTKRGDVPRYLGVSRVTLASEVRASRLLQRIASSSGQKLGTAHRRLLCQATSA